MQEKFVLNFSCQFNADSLAFFSFSKIEILSFTMKIRNIQTQKAYIDSNIRNAYINFSEMTISVVVVNAEYGGKLIRGYGFCSNGRYAQCQIIKERFLPRISNSDLSKVLDENGVLDPRRIWQTFMQNEKPGGHGDRAVAAGALDMAFWDLYAKAYEKPLWRILSEKFNKDQFDEKVFVYPGGGYYYPGKGDDGLKDEFKKYQEQGYKVLKMKVGGDSIDEDLRRIEEALSVVGKGENLCVDANARFDLNEALAFADAIQHYNLMWYEEPLDPEDFLSHAILAERYVPSIATGENLFSKHGLQNLLRHGGLRPDRDWIQLDPALSYGLTHYLEIIKLVENFGWSRRRLIPHGGHQLALNIAAGLQTGGSESYPGVFQPFGGFADDYEIVDGFIRPQEQPGLGIEEKSDLFNKIQEIFDYS
jgi:L-alanine-DL-glutamate epimerase-like enolase superfamily enzyme